MIWLMLIQPVELRIDVLNIRCEMDKMHLKKDNFLFHSITINGWKQISTEKIVDFSFSFAADWFIGRRVLGSTILIMQIS